METEQKITDAEIVEKVEDTTTPNVTKEVPAPKEAFVQIPVKAFKRYAYAFVLGVLLVVLSFLFSKGVFVAATVNGSPISRLSVIEKLEQQGGKDALQGIINERLIKSAIAKSNITVDAAAVDTKITEIETQVKAQGGTLAEALTAEGMTMTQLRDQIETQQKLEKLLDDKLKVTDEEVASFITENKITPPTGTDEATLKTEVAAQIKQQKFQEESQKWIAEITESAKIKYYVTY